MAGDPIPEAELIAARLRMQRRVAALIVSALAESGLSYEDVDARLGNKPGFTRRYINRLIEGKERGLNEFSDMCLGIGFEPQFALHHPLRRDAQPEAPSHV